MRVNGLTVAYIGGGSRGWAWGFMKDLAMDGDMQGVVRLYDIDRDAAVKNQRIGEMISAHPKAASAWKYEVSDTLRDALSGADFVVISILPGTFAHMRSDVHLPEKFGIWQPVGDTAGPGGLVRALRAVPMFAEIALAVRDYAPKAWVVNYTNPMAACLLALFIVYPGIRAFGCCHEVFGTQKLLAAMLEDTQGIHGVTRQDIKTGVSGVNHFTWLTRASYEGTDLFPQYREFAQKYHETGFDRGGDGNWMNSHFASSHRVKFDLFLRYGLIAAAGDRHLAEFVPPWYLESPETAHRWGFTLTPVDWREKDLQNRLQKRAAMLENGLGPELEASGEEGHLLIKALLGLGELVSNVNLLNRGQAAGLPLGAVVETNALFTRDCVSPVMEEPLPVAIGAMVTRAAHNQIATVKAALHCDRQEALRALLNDPQACRLQTAQAQQMLDEMIANTLDILPSGWKKN